MKKIFGIILIILFNLLIVLSCATNNGTKNEVILLDQAIKTASENIAQNLGYSTLISSTTSSSVSNAEKTMQTGNMDIESIRQQAQKFNQKPKIAVLNFSSPSTQFSTYVIEELSRHLINTKNFIVVERKELDLISQENKFQMSGDVSDGSIVGIGKKLGAQYIVSGSLTSIGNIYCCRFKVLNVETAEIVMWPSWDINSKDKKVVSLLAGAKPIREGGQTKISKVETVKTYKIGDKGPGGGIVFYAEDGKYMECSKELGKANWNKALQITRAYKGGNKKDWRLPDSYELGLVYQNLFKNGYGRFSVKYYWSSSCKASKYFNDPFYCDFENGKFYTGEYLNRNKMGWKNKLLVIAIRNFE